jgi:hypothetical protein
LQNSNYNYTPFLKDLKKIYAAMGHKYKEAADYYGFNCTGCLDNCCLTRFYHHTHIEYLYILEGYHALEEKKKIDVTNRAVEVCEKTAAADKKGKAVRLMCPLNLDGLCILYAYRPMICRLHGIPHELQRPGQKAVYGPGCEAFTQQCKEKGYFKFDRTPFYIEMVQLEKKFKQKTGTAKKFKKTIAQMLIPGS